jgi:DNA mismatch repair protein MutL
MYLKTFGTLPPEEKNNNLEKQESKTSDAFEIIKDNNVSIFEGVEEYKKPKYKFIGIAFNTYIIFEIDKELYILDQHAAHERIMYEKVKKNYYSEDGKNSQMLLLPDIITLTHKEMDIAKENMKMFEKAGFVLEEFGENTIKLSGVPDVCLDINTKELFLETLDEINTIARTAKQEIEERFLATVACKAAVKANMVLAEEEVNSLLDKLLELPNPFTCPHGRPTTIKMTKYDIERKFARK